MHDFIVSHHNVVYCSIAVPSIIGFWFKPELTAYVLLVLVAAASLWAF